MILAKKIRLYPTAEQEYAMAIGWHCKVYL